MCWIMPPHSLAMAPRSASTRPASGAAKASSVSGPIRSSWTRKLKNTSTRSGTNSDYECPSLAAVENPKSNIQSHRLRPPDPLLTHDFCHAVRPVVRGAGMAEASGDLARAFLDPGGNGRGAERGDGLQSVDGPEVRR